MSVQRSRTPAAARPLSLAAALLSAFLITLLAAACSSPAAPDPSAEATISALATSNAQLSTQVADLVAGAATPAPASSPAEAAPVAAPAAETNESDAAALPAVAAEPADSVLAVAQPGDGPLPQLLAEIPLASGGETLYDLRIDRATNHLFVTDSADQLHVLDATTYAPLAVLPYGGWLELDSAHQRLYVYKPYITQDEESLIHVIDTGTLEVAGSIPGRALAVDSERNRLFAGEPYVVSLEQDAPGVRIVDGATLQQTGIFTQSGAPVYNPLRDELLIAAYTVYSADPETQQVTADLFPELTDVGDTGFLWCNSCAWVDEIQYFPAEQIVMVAISHHCTGAGCGRQDPPRFFDAASMEPVDAALAPEVQADCGSQASLAGAVDGRRYHNEMYARYVVFNNLLVTDTQGAPITQRDGLRIDYVNGRTGQGYLYDGMVLDLASLAPIGRWPAACLMAEEPDAGLLYGYRNGSLYVIAERGAEPVTPAAGAAGPLPTEWPLRQIAVSPNYAADNTLLAVSGGGIYRSTDGAQSWQRLAGGLPGSQESRWVVAFSPTYAEDRTIFAAGDRDEYWGEGVWRSTDGGDVWQAGWDNLQHRRISNLYIAPDFAANQTLVAQANYNSVATIDSGISLQQSTDGGLTWTLVATSTASGPSTLPPISELLPGYAPPPALPVRQGALLDSVQVTLDGTEWITVPLDAPEGEWFYAMLPAPSYPDEPTLYVFGHLSLWRSVDGGATWSAWEDGRLGGLDYTNQMSTASITPALADGSHRLLVGTANGQVWVLDPAQMVWGEAVDAAPPASVAAALATPTPGVVTPPTASASGQPTTGVTSTASVTSTAGITNTAGVTATIAPTATAGAAGATVAGTPTPVVTAEPLAGDPPAGLFRPEGSLALVWNANARIQQDVGWARQATPNVVAGAYQRFEHGVMVWRSDTSQIYAFLDDGSWYSFADTFEEGDQESDLRYVPPAGKQQPIRGFGKVWRENPDLREQIGWATAKEEAQPAEVHLFERGQMLRYGALLFTVVGVDTDSGRWY